MKRIIFAGCCIITAVVSVAMSQYLNKATENIPVMLSNISAQIVPAEDGVSFSPGEHFYSEDVKVKLSYPDENAKIYYTRDGSTPTVDSLEYTGPIELQAWNAVRAVTIKAIAVSGDKTSDVVTRSYVVGTDVEDRFENALVFVLSGEPDDFYSYERGILVEGKVRADFIAENPGAPIEPTTPANYHLRGMESERPIYTEVFDSEGNPLISQAAGVRVFGAYNRGTTDQKSLRLIARKSYDPENGKFKYDFFSGDINASGSPITEYDRIVLRSAGNDREFAGLRDELSQDLATQAGFPDTQETRPAAVFLNGTYYGYAWLHENFNESYLEDNYGGVKEQYAIVEGGTEEMTAGDERIDADYAKVMEFYYKDLTVQENFEALAELIDIENYLFYTAIQGYIDNRDWPRGNTRAWRYYPAEGEPVSGYNDGKWRYMLFDAEFAWGLYEGGNYNNKTFTGITGLERDGGVSPLLTQLLKREDMREKLGTIVCDLISGAFSAENVYEVLQSKIDICYPEFMYAISAGKVSFWANAGSYEDNWNQIRRFADNRPSVVYNDLIELLGLSGEFYEINVQGTDGAAIHLNTLTCEEYESVSGSYFTEYGVDLYADIFTGFSFSHWIIDGEEVYEEKVRLDSDMLQGDFIDVSLVLADAESGDLFISEIYYSENEDWLNLYNPYNETTSTGGLYLTDDRANLKKWALPNITVPAGEKLVVVAKNNKSANTLLKLQADFSFKEGETIILSDENGEIISSVTLGIIGSGMMYTRTADGKYIETEVELE